MSDDHQDQDEKKDEKKESGLQDIIKRVVSVGVGAAFMTEESVRSILGDLPLPKDIVSGLVQNAKGAKTEFTQGLREEFKKYLSRLDTENIIEYIAENYDVEVNASFSFKKKTEGKDTAKKSKSNEES
jgi:hypothetical protein